jgi:hypothetical protein
MTIVQTDVVADDGDDPGASAVAHDAPPSFFGARLLAASPPPFEDLTRSK